MASPIADLLLADAAHSPDVALFGCFVGSWTFDGTSMVADGSKTRRVSLAEAVHTSVGSTPSPSAWDRAARLRCSASESGLACRLC